MPAAVLFDLYNTLVDGGDGGRDATVEAMAVDLGIDPLHFVEVFSRSYPDRCLGRLGGLEATVRALAAQCGGRPTDSAVRLACTRRLSLVRGLLWPRASTLSALDALRRAGWRTAVVSNCSIETATLWKTNPLASAVDAAVFSCTLGVGKPDPTIFLAACSALATTPAECLYVGDGADNELGAAASLGMTVVRTEEYVPASNPWPRQRVANLTQFAAPLAGEPLRPDAGPPAF